MLLKKSGLQIQGLYIFIAAISGNDQALLQTSITPTLISG